MPPRVHVSADSRNGSWVFSLSDNGIGIAPEDAKVIFHPFRRLHQIKLPGTGIGLAICQRVIERPGGRIRVDSEPGKGSTFHFTIPQ